MIQYVEELYSNLPIITKSYVTACVLTTLAFHLDLVSLLMLYLNFRLVYERLEVWRLITNFLFFGGFGIPWIFNMYFLLRHSTLLEETSFRGRTADYLFLFLFGVSSLLFVDWFLWYTALLPTPPILFLGPSLSFMIVYVWSRRNPNVRMSFLALFTFNAPYLPYVIIGIELMLGQPWSIFDMLGIFIGHTYFFLEDVYPRYTGRRVLKTPQFLKTLLDQPSDVGGVAGQ
eukprot:TRINITY_DN7395_c0_g2_i2.p1 TRINITY_DN7395_c0_g2~~TRINITY_DN7395_c0_g2_i2.p1  ORF type:complete len:245 (-),score=30.50 TRINITY_DN7395_c0_g2_i2:50-739(-)